MEPSRDYQNVIGTSDFQLNARSIGAKLVSARVVASKFDEDTF